MSDLDFFEKEEIEHKLQVAYQRGFVDGEEKGREDAIEEILSVLISDGDYGHETFSLTYLKGLLKQLKEGSNG